MGKIKCKIQFKKRGKKREINEINIVRNGAGADISKEQCE